ncbi:MAG TPA: addiction module protein [Thermoanaerobaculia bacterium]|nr:addiction module protein [Thermoanaerobaculia bacterium]
MDIKSLARQALSLPPNERARLAQELLESLDSPPERKLDQIWLDEAEHRGRQIDDGSVALVPGDEVLRKAQALSK